MNKKLDASMDTADLRQRAEERMKLQKPSGGNPRTELEAVWFVHELQVHQIELELQIEELKASREAALAESEGKYRALFESSRDAIMTLGPPSWKFDSCNPASAKIFGARDVKEFMSYTPWELSPEQQPDGRNSEEKAKEIIETVMREGSHFFEWTIKRIGGDLFSATVLVSRLQVNGKVFLQATVRDISEFKRVEARVLKLNRVYSVLSCINQLIVREKDPQALLLEACCTVIGNGKYRMAWVGMLDDDTQTVKPVASAGFVDGYLDTINIELKDKSSSGPISQTILSGERVICVDINSDPRMAALRDDALQRGYRSSASFPLKRSGRTVGTFTLYASEPDFFDADELRLLDELAADISYALEVYQREEGRKLMEDSHDRMAMAVEQAAETIVITDLGGTILYANPAFEKSTGYTRAEALGRNSRMLKSGKQDAAFYREMWDVLKRGEVWHGHFSNKHKDGAIYEENATISPIRDAKGKTVSYVAVKRDVTHEMKIEAQYRQSQKMEAFGLLAGGVAHDFNNLMSVVMGYSDLWLMKLPPDAPIRAPLNAIKNAGERASCLTKQLLAFSRQTVLEPKVLDLNTVVRETEKMLGRLIGEDVVLSSVLDTTIPRVKVDPGQIGQVLMNLAVNARDSMPRGGALTIETGTADFDDAYVQSHLGAKPGRHAMLSVSDTGTGMPPEIVARIFEPFFTTKGVGKGTGLGLAVVHGVVTQSGGSIQVESTVGAGTTFKLFLPATSEAHQPANKSGQIVIYAGIETILIVEDEDTLCEITRQSLQSFGYTVLTARSGSDALKLMKTHDGSLDLILTDVVMPGMSGRELADTLKQTLPELKIVFMSGYTADSVVRHGIDHEKVAFLQKPFAPFDLLKKIREELDRQ